MTDDDKRLVERLKLAELKDFIFVMSEAAARIEALAGEVEEYARTIIAINSEAVEKLVAKDAEIVRLWSALSCAVGKIEGLGGDAGYLKQMVDGCIKGGGGCFVA